MKIINNNVSGDEAIKLAYKRVYKTLLPEDKGFIRGNMALTEMNLDEVKEIRTLLSRNKSNKHIENYHVLKSSIADTYLVWYV